MKKEKEYFEFIEQLYVDQVKIETKDLSKDQLIEKIAGMYQADDEEYSYQTGYSYGYLGGLEEFEMEKKFKEKKND
jgi:hypothetical protein